MAHDRNTSQTHPSDPYTAANGDLEQPNSFPAAAVSVEIIGQLVASR